MQARPTVCAVVVTHNRKNLLRDCLSALLSQSVPVDCIKVVNNASSDGTDEMLRKEFPQVDVIHLEQNIGGAGGFHIGVKRAYRDGYDWIWLMDDDVIPQPEALQMLLTAAQLVGDEVAFLCSRVVSPKGHPLNVPKIDERPSGNGYADWARFLADGIVRVRWCTFVSVLVSRAAVERVGLPLRQMYIWGDDIEYTLRLSSYAPAYMVGKSVVVHMRTLASPPHLLTEVERSRVRLHFYGYRNRVFIQRKYFSAVGVAKVLLKALWTAVKAVVRKKDGLYRAGIAIGGVLAGLVFNPQIEGVE